MKTLNQNRLTLATNNLSPQIRTEFVDGIEYAVYPATMLKEGVLNGFLVPFTEFQAHASGFNGIPFVVPHPTDIVGNHVSANSPQVIEDYCIGRVFNVKIDPATKSLKGEIFLDHAKAAKIGGDAEKFSQLIQTGQIQEISTAYLARVEEASGVFNGKAYKGIQRGLVPDHLAGLVSEPGACSVQDGCGTPIANSSKEDDMSDLKPDEKKAFKLGQFFLSLISNGQDDVSDEELCSDEQTDLEDSSMEVKDMADESGDTVVANSDNELLNGISEQLKSIANSQLTEDAIRAIVRDEMASNVVEDEVEDENEETNKEETAAAVDSEVVANAAKVLGVKPEDFSGMSEGIIKALVAMNTGYAGSQGSVVTNGQEKSTPRGAPAVVLANYKNGGGNDGS